MEILDIGSYKPTLESMDVKKLRAIGPHLLIVLDEPPKQTTGGIILPDQAQKKMQKRRGWVLSPGTGVTTKHGVKLMPPWGKGDYVVADRTYARPDETEDWLCTDPVVMMVDAADVLAMDPDRRPSSEIQKVIDQYGD
jgi:co-chaperonin GroES (HSP10)